MQVGTIYILEFVFWNQSILLVVGCDCNVVNLTLILGIDKEQETRIEGGILEHSTSLVNFYLPIIVNIGDTSSYCKILSNVRI